MMSELLRFQKNIKYSFLDIESYNLCLNFCFNAPWEIEILQSIGTKTINSTNYIINWLNEKPNLLIEPEVAIKNHYSKEKILKEGKDPKDVFLSFWPLLQNCDKIVSHNVLNFDLYLLKEYALYMNKDWKFLLNKIIDTNALAKGIKLGIKFDNKKESFLEYQFRLANIVQRGLKTNLAAMAKEYDIKIEDERKLHSATFDVEINKLVWEHMIWLIDI